MSGDQVAPSVPTVPSPSPQYSRENEAAFRRMVQATFRKLVQQVQNLTEVAYAGLYWSSTATAAVASSGTYVKFDTASSTTEIVSENFTVDTNNRLTYTGEETKDFLVAVHVSVSAANSNEELAIRLAKNGTTETGSEVDTKHGSAGDEEVLSCAYVFNLAQGDYVELWATNNTTNADIFLDHGTMTATEI